MKKSTLEGHRKGIGIAIILIFESGRVGSWCAGLASAVSVCMCDGICGVKSTVKFLIERIFE